MAQWRRLCWQLMRTTLVSQGNSLLAPMIGLVLCAPKLLAGTMTLGELTQAAAAFTLVQGSFNWLVDNYGRVADWISSLERVGGLLLLLDQLNHRDAAGRSRQDRRSRRVGQAVCEDHLFGKTFDVVAAGKVRCRD